MKTSPDHSSRDFRGSSQPDAGAEKTADAQAAPGGTTRGRVRPWYAGEHKDTLFYLLIAVLFVEMIVGGVSFFYGLVHAAPEAPGGPPVARFPWLIWALAAVLAPVALLLVVHLTGRWLSHTLEGEQDGADSAAVPERLQRFTPWCATRPRLCCCWAFFCWARGSSLWTGLFPPWSGWAAR